jgi:hypothetical protein
MGVGGNAGTLSPAVNAVDRASSLVKGYATAVTDTGHVGNGTDAAWVRAPDGKRDEAKITDAGDNPTNPLLCSLFRRMRWDQTCGIRGDGTG